MKGQRLNPITANITPKLPPVCERCGDGANPGERSQPFNTLKDNNFLRRNRRNGVVGKTQKRQNQTALANTGLSPYSDRESNAGGFPRQDAEASLKRFSSGDRIRNGAIVFLGKTPRPHQIS